MEQLDAAAAAHSLNQTHANLTQTFTAEVAQINKLISAYNSAAGAARNFSMNNPGMMMPGRAVRKLADGIVSVPGSGNKDTVPAMLTPGESVIPAKMTKKYAPLINGMIADNIPGYQKGRSLGTAVDVPGGMDISHFGMKSSRTGSELLAMVEGLETTAAKNIRKMVASFDNGLSKVFTTFDNQVVAQFTEINRLMQTKGKANTQKVKQNIVGAGFAETRDVELQRQLVSSGMAIDEFKVINKKITDGIIKGFDALGDKTEITSEELNNLLRKSYEEVAKTDARVEKAYNNMKQVSTAFDPDRAGVRGSRIPITEESYVRQKKSTQRTPSQYRKMQSQMVGAENIPYPQSSRFVVTHNVAKELGITSNQAAEIYNKMSINAKTTLSRMRNDLTAFKKEFIIEAAKVGEMVGTSAVNATATAAGTNSPSRKTRRTGEDIGRGLEEGMKSRQDDVALVGSQLGKAATTGVQGGVGSIPFRAPGQPGSVAANAPRPGVSLGDITAKARFNRDALLAAASQRQTAKMNARMNSLNKAFMSGTFALSALSGVASMSSGNLGKFSQILFQITGPLFALSSILQLFTGQKIIGIIKNIGKLKFGVAAIALTGFVVATKLINDARKKELEYIYGLSNAMKTTTQQVKTLGDFFGIVPTKLPIDLKNREVVRKETRSARDRLRADEGFQAEFAPTIKTLSAATAEEARLAFTTLALNLKAQGFAEQQVQTIVDALREEAGKTSIKLDVKSLNFSAESIKGIQTQIAPIILSLEKSLKTGPTGAEGLFKGFKNSFLQAFQGKTPGALDTMSNAAKKSLSELSTTISSVSNSAAGMFKLGLISADDFEATMFGILGTTKNLNAENQKLVLMEIFKSLNIDAAPFLANLKGAVLQMQTLALISSGVLDKDSGIFKLLASKDYEDQQRGRKALIKLYDETIGVINKVTKADKDAEASAAAAAAAAGKTNPLKERIEAIKKQTEAFILLRNAKIDEKTATELSNDAEIASYILKNKSSKLLPKIIADIKEYSKVLKAQAQAEKDFADPTTTFKNELERLQAVAKLREKLIDIDFAPKIKKETDELTAQEQKLADINEKIQQITRTEIDPKKTTIDKNNLALEKIAAQEDVINEKYNKQIEALDKIEKANQNIANIQKQRMSIADALTRGDISAAAMAMQDARAERAQSAVTGQREGLTANRDMAITALGRVALEKENKQLQLEISTIEATQLKTLESQKQVIEDKIVSINKNITTLNKEVSVLKEGSYYAGKTKEDIDNLAELISAAEAAGIPFTAELLKQATNAERLAAALLKSSGYMSGLSSSAVSGAGAPTTETTKSDQVFKKVYEESIAMGNTVSGARAMAGMSSRLQAQADAYFKANPNIDPFTGAQRKMFGGPILSKGKGGMGIVKAMAFGGRAIGSDTVPAMLTPGEFIVNKSASRAYAPLLERINESKYPGMLSGGGQPQVPVNNISTSTNDNSTAVYNYNLGFSINGANGSAKDIANAVMREIKNVDSQRIRGQRQ